MFHLIAYRTTMTQPSFALRPAAPSRPRPVVPVVFGPSGRPLAGFFHAPPAGATRACGVVVCSPFGYEAICGHRSLRHLASALAAAGFPTLRFDYDGTGDSAGLDTDPDRLAAWTRSVAGAVEELARLGACDEIALVGVRMGALLAARAAATRPEVRSLVLWNPCASGRAFLREQRALQIAMELTADPSADAKDEAGQEAAGFLLTTETVAALEKVDMRRTPPERTGGVLVIERADLPSDAKLHEALRAAGGTVDVRRAPDLVDMLQDPHKAIVPRATIDETVGWLSARHPAGAARALEPPDPPRLELVAAGAEGAAAPPVHEEPIAFGSDDRLFGVISSPARPAAKARPAVLLLNAGTVHHVGPNRNWVTIARALAAAGFTALRLDLSGIGESDAAPGEPENQAYGAFPVPDVRAAMAALRERCGAERFVVAGLCAGAHNAFHAALAAPAIAEAILINPVTFYWKPGMSLELRPARVYTQTERYKQGLFKKETWSRALRGEIDLRRVARTIARRAADVARAKGERLLRRVGVSVAADDLERDLDRLAARGIFTCLVFGAGEPGLDHVRMHAPRALSQPESPLHRTVIIDGPDHTFTPIWAQRRLVETLVDHLRRRYP